MTLKLCEILGTKLTGGMQTSTGRGLAKSMIFWLEAKAAIVKAIVLPLSQKICVNSNFSYHKFQSYRILNILKIRHYLQLGVYYLFSFEKNSVNVLFNCL
jgi:hypothetical protein